MSYEGVGFKYLVPSPRKKGKNERNHAVTHCPFFHFADENNAAAGLVRLHLSHYCTGSDCWAEGKFTHMCLIFILKMITVMIC